MNLFKIIIHLFALVVTFADKIQATANAGTRGCLPRIQEFLEFNIYYWSDFDTGDGNQGSSETFNCGVFVRNSGKMKFSMIGLNNPICNTNNETISIHPNRENEICRISNDVPLSITFNAQRSFLTCQYLA
jgi:hypothetical protein